MYDAVEDPYCYPGTTVLKNIPGLRTQAELDAFEAVSVVQRAEERFPAGRLALAHYCSIHRHLFQDVYPWAGKFRTVRMSKENSAFCYPEYIAPEMKALFGALASRRHLRGLTPSEFAHDAADFLTTLNASTRSGKGTGEHKPSSLPYWRIRLGTRSTSKSLHPMSSCKP